MPLKLRKFLTTDWPTPDIRDNIEGNTGVTEYDIMVILVEYHKFILMNVTLNISSNYNPCLPVPCSFHLNENAQQNSKEIDGPAE